MADRRAELARAMLNDNGTMPAATILLVSVPESMRNDDLATIRRKLSHPQNVAMIIDQVAEAIHTYHRDPVSAQRLMRDLSDATEIAARAEQINRENAS